MKILMDKPLRLAVEQLAVAFASDDEDNDRNAMLEALAEFVKEGEAERCLRHGRVAWRATDKLLKRLREEEQETTEDWDNE